MSLASLVARHPRFAPAVNPQPESVLRSVDELANPTVLQQSLDAAMHQYSLEAKFAAQVWWFSFCNSIVVPMVTEAVEASNLYSLDLRTGQLFQRQASNLYWFGFAPSATVADMATAKEQFCSSAAPIMKELAQLAGVRIAPLLAIAEDAFVQAAVNAGNDDFDPALGVEFALECSDRVRLSVVRDGQMVSLDADPALVQDDDMAFARRNSCCMIYRSPRADMCLSCPKQVPEERDAALLDYALQQGM